MPTCRAVIDLASAGAFPRPCPCRRSTPGKRAESGQAGHRAAVPVVPTIDAGKLVIDLASAGAFPAAVPVPTIDGGQLGKLVIVPRSSTWQRVAVPVVPMIDAGQFQGQADGGQGGHRPGKRRAFPRPCPCRRAARSPWCRRSTPASWSSAWQVPGPSRGRARADDRRRATRQVGHRAARGVDDRRRPVPTASVPSSGKPVIVPRSPWCRRSTPASWSSTWQAPGPSPRPCPCRRSTAGNSASWSSCRGHRPGNVSRSPWCRRSTPASSKGKPTAGKAVIDLASAGPSRGRARADVPRGPRGADDRRRQAGHRPGKRRGLPAAVPVPTIDGGQLGKLVIVPPVVPTIDAGQACRVRARRSSTWQRAAVPVVPTIDGGKLTPASWSSCRPWCRRSTPASWSSCRRAARSSTWQAPGPSRGRARADDRRRASVPSPGKPVIVPRSPWCRRSTPASWHRPGKRRGLPRGRARADDRRRATRQAGHRAAVIDLATCRGPRGADDRRRPVPRAS